MGAMSIAVICRPACEDGVKPWFRAAAELRMILPYAGIENIGIHGRTILLVGVSAIQG